VGPRNDGFVNAVHEAKGLAREFLLGMGSRWAHVVAVGQTVERFAEVSGSVNEDLVCAAWLHDLGYAPELLETGMHALDGAKALERVNMRPLVVGLVAYHTGAVFEAAERGLSAELATVPVPDQDSLDMLTLVDLSISPTGRPITEADRIAEILARYDRGHPVSRAVSNSKEDLLASCGRARRMLGLPDDWPIAAGERVGDAEPHRRMQF
jgi:hypothetical protein